jgi:replicative DNA helicase
MPVEKLPPQNVEAEEAVLGSILIDRDAIVKTAPILKPEDFYREKNGWIYDAVLNLYDRHEPADFVTLCDEMERRGQLDDVGGREYMTALLNAVPTAVHAEYYAKIIERCATLRRLIGAAGQIAAIGYTDEIEADTAIDQAEQVLFQVAERRQAKDFIGLREALHDYAEQLDILHAQKGHMVGVPTGFIDLDRLLGGLRPSDFIVLAARPSAGKTALAMGIAHNAAKTGIPVGIFSLEMSVSQLVQRMLAMETRIDSHRLGTGYFGEDDWQTITQAMGVLSELPVFVDDSASATVMEIRTKARRLKAEQNIGLIVIDYLQLMAGRGLENRVQEVSEISRALKGLARELSIPVLTVSQLSRAVESRTDHMPILSDLRESGSIEQDADVVIFIHRDKMYNENTPKGDVADVRVAKHRNGPVDTVHLRFFPEFTQFADLATY